MPKPPTDPPTGVQYRPETADDREAIAAALDPREGTAAASNLNTLISRRRWEAWAELLHTNGNAFAVGGKASGPGAHIMAWDFLARPLIKAEVANLVAWLLMISEVTAAELQVVCQAQGINLRAVLELEPEAAVCSECGGELAAKCVACGKSFP